MRCYFYYSADGMANLRHDIVRQNMAEGVANLTTLPTGFAKIGAGYSEARFG